MHQWTFVIAAYAVTLVGTAAICLISWNGMRRAERRADTVASRP